MKNDDNKQPHQGDKLNNSSNENSINNHSSVAIPAQQTNSDVKPEGKPASPVVNLETTNKKTNSKSKIIIILLAIVALLAAGGFAYAKYQSQPDRMIAHALKNISQAKSVKHTFKTNLKADDPNVQAAMDMINDTLITIQTDSRQHHQITVASNFKYLTEQIKFEAIQTKKDSKNHVFIKFHLPEWTLTKIIEQLGIPTANEQINMYKDMIASISKELNDKWIKIDPSDIIEKSSNDKCKGIDFKSLSSNGNDIFKSYLKHSFFNIISEKNAKDDIKELSTKLDLAKVESFIKDIASKKTDSDKINKCLNLDKMDIAKKEKEVNQALKNINLNIKKKDKQFSQIFINLKEGGKIHGSFDINFEHGSQEINEPAESISQDEVQKIIESKLTEILSEKYSQF